MCCGPDKGEETIFCEGILRLSNLYQTTAGFGHELEDAFWFVDNRIVEFRIVSSSKHIVAMVNTQL